MKFTIPVSISQHEPKIDHNSKIFLAGSCFVENIGDKFDYYKLSNKRNPLGILYHPFGIKNLIKRAVAETKFIPEEVFYHNERWHCFEAHSSLSDPDKDHLLNKLNDALQATRSYLTEATHIIITPGTSWIYRQIKNKKAVANCHKLPRANFKKEISEVNEIEEALNTTVSQIHTINPTAQIIFTISPVRHIKDGLVENQLSKSLLFVAVHKIIAAQKYTSYFLSYEILLDELRDYRYYAEDMLHPGKVGIDYIWQKFSSSWLSSDAILILKEIETIQRGLSHRPFNTDSDAHKKFSAAINSKIEFIQSRFPHLEF